MTRDQFFIWLQSFRTAQELDDRAAAITDLLTSRLAIPVYADDSDEIMTIDLTASGLEHMPIVLPPTHE
jgi:hypothetical protein